LEHDPRDDKKSKCDVSVLKEKNRDYCAHHEDVRYDK
jgi:hypothetical protein